VLGKEGADVHEIIRRFDYSEAQLARDLNTVFVCGLPGYGPGDLMEAYIDEDEVVIDAADYFARAPRLNSTEALSLLAAGLAIVGTGQASPELESAVKKLSRVVVPDADRSISVDVSGEAETLEKLRDAATNNKVVRITYRSLGKEQETVRDIEPWNVFATLGNWYVQGHCRLVDGERVFRVDRIREMEVTDDIFERPKKIPDPVVDYIPSDDDVVTEIALGPRAMWVTDYYPVEVLKTKGKETIVRFSSPEAEVPARLLLRLGPDARLVSGEEVRRRVKSLGKNLLATYR
jgi:proteasome accessory factor C